MAKTVAIVQARLSSTRLPEKVLKPLLSKPVLAHVIDRLDQVNLIDEVVIATTIDKEDDPLIDWCKKNGKSYFRGDLTNVLSRFYYCANQYQADHIVRVTSDNPLVDPFLVEQTLKHYFKTKSDYCANNIVKSFPHGLDVEVFSFESLRASFEEAKEAFELEHVTQFIRHRVDRFKVENYLSPKPMSHIRITCDEPEDFQLIKIILKILGESANFHSIVKLFEELPALCNVNKSAKLRHKEYNDGQGIK